MFVSYMCDGTRRFPARSLSYGHQAQPGLVTDITLYHNSFNVLQIAAPRAAICFHLAMGGRHLRRHHTCWPH